jgi:hypothetical protein
VEGFLRRREGNTIIRFKCFVEDFVKELHTYSFLPGNFVRFKTWPTAIGSAPFLLSQSLSFSKRVAPVLQLILPPDVIPDFSQEYFASIQVDSRIARPATQCEGVPGLREIRLVDSLGPASETVGALVANVQGKTGGRSGMKVTRRIL